MFAAAKARERREAIESVVQSCLLEVTKRKRKQEMNWGSRGACAINEILLTHLFKQY